MYSTSTNPSGRYLSLDGMRGLAAFVVFVFHGMLTSPTFCAIADGAPAQGWTWWLAHTPLRLLWAGDEAVTVFFVLSGFVLCLPYLRAKQQAVWRSYYAARLVRLYVPVAGALLLTAVSYLLVDHHVPASASRWMIGHDLVMTPSIVLHDLLLIDGTGYFNSVLWSLRWEVIFSLLLPVALQVAILAGRWRAPLALVTVALLAVCGVFEISSASYLLMFGFGELMAAERERLGELAQRLSSSGWSFVSALAVALLLCRWWPGVEITIAPALITVGAGLLLATCLWCPWAVRACQSLPVKWLGERSFTFYLIQDPIVTCSALLLGTENPALVLGLALPSSLAVTAVFFALVERPSHRAAKRAGRFAASLWLRRPLDESAADRA